MINTNPLGRWNSQNVAVDLESADLADVDDKFEVALILAAALLLCTSTASVAKLRGEVPWTARKYKKPTVIARPIRKQPSVLVQMTLNQSTIIITGAN